MIQLELRSGNAASQYGAGLAAFVSTNTVSNCIICGNSAEDAGGGVENNGSKMQLTNCAIKDNSVQSLGTNSIFDGGGGGVFNFAATATLTNCTVSDKIRLQETARLTISLPESYANSATLIGCTVSGNSAVAGGGIFNQGAAQFCLFQHHQQEPEKGDVPGERHQHVRRHRDDHQLHHQQEPGQLIRHRPGRRDPQREQRPLADERHDQLQPGQRRDGPGRRDGRIWTARRRTSGVARSAAARPTAPRWARGRHLQRWQHLDDGVDDGEEESSLQRAGVIFFK